MASWFVIVALAMLSLLTTGSKAPVPEAVKPVPEAEVISSQQNVTTATQLLVLLPEAKEKVSVAVYDIMDKTGQYKENEHISNSRAVTQGATEMLITALMRSHQFTVLDRVYFENVLNEQNLKRKEYLAEGASPTIGALIGADYIIEGAITEYDVDIRTEGLGVKIAGKGGSTEYARASAAIDLRMTDTTTGEIVWAKALKKEILGKRVGINLFSFMEKNIVEFEMGKGKQQAINLVIRTLLEEVVYKLCKSEIFAD